MIIYFSATNTRVVQKVVTEDIVDLDTGLKLYKTYVFSLGGNLKHSKIVVD